MQLDQFIDLLACPDCREPVRREGDELVCDKCGRRYRLRGGVPLMFPADDRSEAALKALETDEGRRMQEEYGTPSNGQPSGPTESSTPGPKPPEKKTGLKNRLKSFLERLREPIHQYPTAEIDAMYHWAGDATRILSIGGGPTRNNEREINLNLGLFPNVDIVGDAHHLPFLDGRVDGIWCNAVLEHVENLDQVVAEMQRVLRPGGYVFIFNPFLFGYHGYPGDYRRLTKTGLTKLFPDFDIVASGTGVGPTYGLLLLGDLYIQHFAPILLRTRRPKIIKAIQALYTLLFYPLKHLDRILNRHEESHLLACMLYYMGRK